MTPGNRGMLRGAIVPIVVRPPIQLHLVSLSTRLLDVETRVTVVVNDLPRIPCLRAPGHEVVRYPSENVLYSLPIFIVGC